MNLQQELSAWDRKSSDEILEIYRRHSNLPGFVETMVELIVGQCEETGSTWLLKHYLESGNQMHVADIQSIYATLPDLDHWEARLQILQSIPFMPIPKESRTVVECFLRKNITDDNKFVRAWSYNGLYELAVLFPDLKNEVKMFLDMALQDEAPSVKARIRNIMKKGF